ncbi:MAG: hypothetical protein HC834_03810 [Rhodospirillales bacterium]|nr:hypothetical protein [Rhodospirillales bacterium]
MTWIHTHDEAGVADHPDDPGFPLHIRDYWTNEAGVRIGFFGYGKGVSEFTYRKGDLNFKFSAIRAPMQEPEIVDRSDRTLGPICSVYLSRDRRYKVDGKRVVDPRDDLFRVQPIEQIKAEITDFLLIYRDPRFPSPIAIEKVEFPLEQH